MALESVRSIKTEKNGRHVLVPTVVQSLESEPNVFSLHVNSLQLFCRSTLRSAFIVDLRL